MSRSKSKRDPPGPMATVTSAATNQRRSTAKGAGPSVASSSPGKERIKKRAERERQRKQLSLEEQAIVDAVQQQRVVAAVAASLMKAGAPDRSAGAGAGGTGATAAGGAVDKGPVIGNELDLDEDGFPKEVEDASTDVIEMIVSAEANDNDGDTKSTPDERATPSTANDNKEYDGDDSNRSLDTESGARSEVEGPDNQNESKQEVEEEYEDIDKGTAIAAALSLIAASAFVDTDVSKSKSFDESAQESFSEEGAAGANAGASPVELENGWSGTVTLQPPITIQVDEETQARSQVMDNSISNEVQEEREEDSPDISEVEMNIKQDEVEPGAKNKDIAGKGAYAVDSITVSMEQMAVEAKHDNNDTNVSIDNTIDKSEEEEQVDAKDRVAESNPRPVSDSGSERKEGASELKADEDVILTPRRKKIEALSVVVGDNTAEGAPVEFDPNVVDSAPPSASELIPFFEAQSPKAGEHGFVPPSPRSASNRGGQIASSPPSFHSGSPTSKAPVSSQIIKTPPRHPPSRGSNSGPQTYEYPQRTQSPWANSLSQSIAKGVCEAQQSPPNEPNNETDRILLEMKKMELRMEARMLRMEQQLEKQMRSKFKHLEARMDERMDEIQASLQIILSKDITEI